MNNNIQSLDRRHFHNQILIGKVCMRTQNIADILNLCI